MFDKNFKLHQYYLSSTNTTLRDEYFNTRKEAEAKMNGYCAKHALIVECVECDKHSRLYSANDGSSFCINRI